jgi:hypothetical protein
MTTTTSATAEETQFLADLLATFTTFDLVALLDAGTTTERLGTLANAELASRSADVTFARQFTQS